MEKKKICTHKKRDAFCLCCSLHAQFTFTAHISISILGKVLAIFIGKPKKETKRKEKTKNRNELENFKFMFHMSSVINYIADKGKDRIASKNTLKEEVVVVVVAVAAATSK